MGMCLSSTVVDDRSTFIVAEVNGDLTDERRDRPDLAALLQRLLSALTERETELLQTHGVSMWEYVVLARLESGAARTQARLAVAVGRDKTRLIPILDRLQAHGLVDRRPDTGDRRNRVVSLTDDGRGLLRPGRRGLRGIDGEHLSAPPPAAAPGPPVPAPTGRALVSLGEQVRSRPPRTPGPRSHRNPPTWTHVDGGRQ